MNSPSTISTAKIKCTMHTSTQTLQRKLASYEGEERKVMGNNNTWKDCRDAKQWAGEPIAMELEVSVRRIRLIVRHVRNREQQDFFSHSPSKKIICPYLQRSTLFEISAAAMMPDREWCHGQSSTVYNTLGTKYVLRFPRGAPIGPALLALLPLRRRARHEALMMHGIIVRNGYKHHE